MVYMTTKKKLSEMTEEELDRDFQRTSVGKAKLHCVYCTAELSPERLARRANTCCEEHSKLAKQVRLAARDQKVCRGCQRPSTPEERAEFAAWRRSRTGETRGRPRKVSFIDERSTSETTAKP